MPQILVFLMIVTAFLTANAQDSISTQQTVELYKWNGKSKFIDIDKDVKIELNDSINELDSTFTSMFYNGYLISRDEEYLYFKPTFIYRDIKHEDMNYWSNYRAHSTPDLPATMRISLDRIKYVSKESIAGYVFASIGGIGLISMVLAPITSIRFNNGNPTINSNFYFKQMAVSIPATIIGFSFYYPISERTFSVKKS